MGTPFGFTLVGIVLNLIGTVLLVFTLPMSFKFENKKMFVTEDNAIELFKERVIEKPDPSIIIALIFLIVGAAFQIQGACHN